MTPGTLLVAVTAFATLIASAILTVLTRKLAISRGLLDVPNARSSHLRTTPRGGGIAIVVSATGALAILTLAGGIDSALSSALIGGGTAVAAIGFADDRHGIPPVPRLLVHASAATWAVVCIGGVPEITVHHRVIHLGWAGDLVSVAGVVWVLNLFNFMDGIDGIAATEAVFVSWAALIPMSLFGISEAVREAGLVIGAASLGFLPWNWPPARIFMGDVGSGYIGYAVATLALASTRQNSDALWVWLILGGVFFVDATVTLARRLVRGERVHTAHRSHAYQWLARRWRSHLRVTLTVLLVNVFWLLPCAMLAATHSASAAAAGLIALGPLVVIALAAGSGRREASERAQP